MCHVRGSWTGAALCAAAAIAGAAGGQVPTTLDDFFLPGSQPNGSAGNPIVLDEFAGAIDGNCVNCHGNFDAQYIDAEPFRHWAGSMMAQAMRDPVFVATMDVANQDADFAGDLCLRCHTPAGWLGGRSLPTDGSALSEPADFEGETCHFCHRMVNPVYVAGQSPTEDVPILDALDTAGLLPVQYGDGRYVLDPDAGVRRGPRDPDVDGIHHPQGAEAIYSPFHTQALICATCHDVSNPVFEKQGDGTYAPGALGTPHATLDKYEMFPVERTYGEWSQSQFAGGGVQLDGRFAPNHATGIMETCQDCHMPAQLGPGCRNNGLVRPDAPQHALNGGNIWVLKAVHDLYPSSETGLTDEIVQETEARITQFLQAASDMTLEQDGSVLRVRVTNYTGHKLPSGYPEGRRIWLNVKFVDDQQEVCQEHGAYDFATATLTTGDTKVYETRLGLDATMAGITGLPEGESFHFAVNNVRLKDNRIPPIGFTNAAFEAVQSEPVAYAYADGQHWDDTEFAIPGCAASATVTLYYQSTSKEYIEFLRDENGDPVPNRGTIAYDAWADPGVGNMSPPVDMDSATIALAAVCPWDCDGSNDGLVGVDDFLAVLAQWGQSGTSCHFTGNPVVGVDEFLDILAHWGVCPQ